MNKLLRIVCAMALILAIVAGCTPSGTQTSSTPGGSTGSTSTGSGGGTPTGEPIKVAVVGPITGVYAEYGLGFLASCELLVEKWNANGGIGGRPIELLSYDEQGTREEGLACAQLIADQGDVYGVIGHFMSILVVPPIYEPKQITFIGPSASSVGFSELGEHVFRNNATSWTNMRSMLDQAVEQGAQKLGMIYLNDNWGTTCYDITVELIETDPKYAGLELLVAESTLDGTTEHAATIAKMKSAGCDTAISAAYYNTMVPFIIQARKTMPDLRILVGGSCQNDTFLNAGGSDVEGVLVTTYFDPSDVSDPEVAAFVEGFKSKRNGELPSGISARAYDSMGILLTAIQEAGGELDREAIRNNVQNISYQGVVGLTEFDEIGDADIDFFSMVVKDGKWVRLQ